MPTAEDGGSRSHEDLRRHNASAAVGSIERRLVFRILKRNTPDRHQIGFVEPVQNEGLTTLGKIPIMPLYGGMQIFAGSLYSEQPIYAIVVPPKSDFSES